MLFGGIVYGIIEIIWRRHTHWTMVITGGICFVLLYRIYRKLRKISLLAKCVIGASIITAVEFVVGCIVNLWLKMNVWDYSKVYLNVFGQICPIYSVLWGFLCVPIVFVCNKIPAFFEKQGTKF